MSAVRSRGTRPVAFVLGRPAGPGSVLPDVIALLGERGIPVTVDVVDDRVPAPLLARWADAGLLVPRGLGLPVLEALRSLAGVPACNPVAATAAARDKVEARRRVLAAGVPIPEAAVTGRWEAVRAFGARRAVVVKAVAGSRGRGIHLTDRPGALPADPPFAGPWIAEERVPADGLDRKLYVIGSGVSGVLRTWPPRTLGDKLGTAFEPSEVEHAVARRAAGAVGLSLAGVDVINGPEGPVVVDVNAFPGFKGVPDAAARIAAHLADQRGAPAVEPASTAREVTACAS
ncbi:MAG TPA: hypothetical protein VM324_05315 [Egibacteraceae bacterium]|nr:hypothetical protein [Egibacteraceae bacterium]